MSVVLPIIQRALYLVRNQGLCCLKYSGCWKVCRFSSGNSGYMGCKQSIVFEAAKEYLKNLSTEELLEI